jgi:hypothetical protein
MKQDEQVHYRNQMNLLHERVVTALSDMDLLIAEAQVRGADMVTVNAMQTTRDITRIVARGDT